MPNKIFAYIDARTFLADVLKEKQSSNPRYSVRAWAKKLGLKSNAPLSLMLSGKRPVPRKYVPVLAEQLRLGKRETEYFDTLVEMSHVKTFKERT